MRKTIRVPYLVNKGRQNGPPRYWQPSKALRLRGHRPQRLSDDLAVAISEAETLNRSASVGQPSAARTARHNDASVQAAMTMARRRARSTGRARYVYVFSSRDGMVKIGQSHAPWVRIRNVATHTPARVELALALYTWPIDARTVEWTVHENLAASRVHGEWFRCNPQAAIKAVISAWWKLSTHKRDKSAV